MSQLDKFKVDYHQLSKQVKEWALEQGFIAANIGKVSLPDVASSAFYQWLENDYAGQMHYLHRHAILRANPKLLMPEALSIISLKMPYWPHDSLHNKKLDIDTIAHVSAYALGRDYHKVLRSHMNKLAKRIESEIGAFSWRAFCDSAPLSEIALAKQAGSGWLGKNTLLLSRKHGSLFFIGEILTNLPLILDESKEKNHCGLCSRCIEVCPTKAIIAPYKLDARRCISYLTIELKDAIPLEFRHLIGNRIYGCDDCQIICPWNKFAMRASCSDFFVRNALDKSSLVELFSWSESLFKERLAGSPIYRIGFDKWLSNIAVALGNAEYSDEIMRVLVKHINHNAELVSEPVHWAISMQKMRYDAR